MDLAHLEDPDRKNVQIDGGLNFRRPHALNLQCEMDWLDSCIRLRMQKKENGTESVPLPPPPKLVSRENFFGTFVNERNLTQAERLLLAIAIAPYVRPNVFNPLHNDPGLAQLVKLIRSSRQTSLLPSGETFLFLFSGMDLRIRLTVQEILTADHFFYRESIIDLAETSPGEPESLGIVSLSPNYRELFIYNREMQPRFNTEFPADLITTNLEWEDLVLAPATERKIEELKQYLSHYSEMVSQWSMQKHAKTGCRILFHGESGTGKTLVATLLGKLLNRKVFRIDLSLVTSKYVGETSKRLRSLFNTAEKKGWILFFDEGDALLGQRKTMTADSPVSQYANQDTAFLLQRIENYDGIVVVATNFRTNIDFAFTRRFEHIIKFVPPGNELLLRLWQQTLPESVALDPKIDLKELTTRYQLSPAAIVDTVYRVCLMTFVRQSQTIAQEDLLRCLKDMELQNKGYNHLAR